MSAAPRLPRVYPISDRGLAGGLSHAAIAGLVSSGGGSILQIREKALPDGKLLEEIRACVAIPGLTVIVNDRPDLALAAGAAGVHLGREDLPPEEARALLGPGALIGLSTRSVEEAVAAAARPVDYVALGPVFPTGTKPEAGPALGSRAIEDAAARLSVPLVAIGGITLERSAELWRAGAASVAVISDIMGAARIDRRMREWAEAAAS